MNKQIKFRAFDDGNDLMLVDATYHREPTQNEICMMCHFSSECKDCCGKCKNKCNGHQVCQLGVDGQADRLEAWMEIVEKNEGMSHLRKFLNVCKHIRALR